MMERNAKAGLFPRCGGGKAPLPPLGTLLFVWLVILAGHMFAGMYADDYLYGSGGFAWEGDAAHYAAIGFNNVFKNSVHSGGFSLQNLLNFLYQHYITWGGRVIPYGIEALCLQAGARFFFCIQSLLMAATFFLGAKIAEKAVGADVRLTLLGMLALYAVNGLPMFQGGYYWASASVHYVWPMPALLGGYYLLIARREKPWTYGAAALLFLFAAACNEILAAMILALLGTNLLVDIAAKRRERLSGNALCLLAGGAGFAFACLAPGNFVRAAHSPMQFTLTIGYLFTQAQTALHWLLRDLWPMNAIMLVTGVALVYFSIVAVKKRTSLYIIPIAVSWLAAFCIYTMGDARIYRVTMPQFMFSCAFASAFCIRILTKLFPHKHKIIFAVLLLASLYPYGHMTRRYYQNYPVLVENDRILRNYTGGNTITLYKLIREKYGAMLYADDSQTHHIDYFRKRFYHLPEKVRFHWISGRELPPRVSE